MNMGKIRLLGFVFLVSVLSVVLCAVRPAQIAQADTRADAAEPFTQEEKEKNAAYGTLRVGYVTDRKPMCFDQEGSGELGGASRYIFDRIQEVSGLKFEYVELPDGQVTYDVLVGDRIDLVTSVEYNRENVNARGILISEPYFSGRKVIVGREGLVFEADKSLKIAVATGSQTLKKVLKKQYPNFEIVDFETIEDCFEAVYEGKADVLIQNQYVAEYNLYKPKYKELKVIPVVGLADELCFSAVMPIEGSDQDKIDAQERSREIVDVINRAISLMGQEEITNFVIRGVMENQYEYSFSDILYRYQGTILFATIVFLIVCVLIFLIIRFYINTMEARAEAKARGQFLSTMSHEIRTPLNGLIGLNYLMLQNLGKPEKLENYLRQSASTAKYLQMLVNDILDMSKLRENEMYFENKPFSLNTTLEAVAFMEKSRMDEKKIHFSLDTELPYPILSGDETRVKQAVLNIIDNAYKFTPKGGRISVQVRQEKRADRKITTTVEVEDTGCGMSEEFQKKIFDSFTKERTEVSKGNQGTGLGMSICYLLAKQMGGDIRVESKVGKGSRFTFEFVLKAVSGTIEKETAPDEEQGRAGKESAADRGEKRSAAGNDKMPGILVAEDNELNAQILMEVLAEKGFQVIVALNGREAVKRFADSSLGEFSIILMDLMMPEMDGYEAAQEIRALDRPDAATVKIFACTANSFKEDRDRAMASGMNDFITKPVDVNKLIEKLKLS